MADDLVFKVKFDLEKGVEAAIKDWGSKYADKLEKAIQKRALNVKLRFDTKAFDNLDDVKRRLAELTPLSPENKTAIRDLVRELKELARISVLPLSHSETASHYRPCILLGYSVWY